MSANRTECTAVVIDGRLDPATCDCEDCTDQVYDDINYAVEMGDISPEEAHDQAVQFGIVP